MSLARTYVILMFLANYEAGIPIKINPNFSNQVRETEGNPNFKIPRGIDWPPIIKSWGKKTYLFI